MGDISEHAIKRDSQRPWLRVLRLTLRSYRLHGGAFSSAAVAFFGVLALAPFGVITLTITGWVQGSERARHGLLHQAQLFLGDSLGTYVVELIDRSVTPQLGVFSALASLAFILFAVTRVFWMSRLALNHLWGVQAVYGPGLFGKHRPVLLRRLLALTMVIIMGAAMLGVTIARVIIDTFAHDLSIETLKGVDIFVAFWGLMALITSMFRLLPDAEISVRDAAVGAMVTALLTTVGAILIGKYMVRFGLTSAYGAAGSVIVLLLWVYYTCQMFFLGAAFAKAWATVRGAGIAPLPHAQRVPEHEPGKRSRYGSISLTEVGFSETSHALLGSEEES